MRSDQFPGSGFSNAGDQESEEVMAGGCALLTFSGTLVKLLEFGSMIHSFWELVQLVRARKCQSFKVVKLVPALADGLRCAACLTNSGMKMSCEKN
jgi:hypothetical protein